MTAADLSASCKQWDIQVEIVKSIYEEFHRQVCLNSKIKNILIVFSQNLPLFDRVITVMNGTRT